MGELSEYARRCKAIELLRKGIPFAATLYTHRRELVVKLDGRVVKRFPCPIREPVVPPLYPLPRGRC